MTPQERAIWLKFRRGILAVNDALEELLEVGRYEPAESSFVPATPLSPEDAPRLRQGEQDARNWRRTKVVGKPRP